MSVKKIIYIAGPTASGKSTAAVQLAQILNCPIISADSRQIYKHLNIGTAKIQTHEMHSVPHHLLDFVELEHHYDVAQFFEDAAQILKHHFTTNDFCIVCGGTGFYIKALLQGIDILPKIEPDLRNKLIDVLNTEGILSLQNWAKQLDPLYYSQIDQNNPMRLMRLIELCTTIGSPISSIEFEKKTLDPSYQHIKILIQLPRELLYHKINLRVDDMMTNGLLNEVKSLSKYRDCQALQTVGYAELFDYLDGLCSLDQAVEKIKQHSRNYAKRQLTWFKKFYPQEHTISNTDELLQLNFCET
ncbi:MAG TPA: tRNA (adenosine(37)-N6)-dimethylallyltransferase MiaA [Saprospiraceae bacterium]|nr:tRNA (adenosine(37)-N6)-dimethylallyltransferase MiaA [Saprospiraceae bacterium]